MFYGPGQTAFGLRLHPHRKARVSFGFRVQIRVSLKSDFVLYVQSSKAVSNYIGDPKSKQPPNTKLVRI